MYSYNNIVAKGAPKNADLLESIGLSETPPPNLRCQKVTEVDATIIEHFLSDAECDSILKVCDELGWSFWGDLSGVGLKEKGSEGTDAAVEEISAKKNIYDNDPDENNPLVTKYESAACAECSSSSDDDGGADGEEKKKKDAEPQKTAEEVQQEKIAAARAFRSADTIEVDLPKLTSGLWRRLSPYIHKPKVVISEEDEDRYERDAEGEWVADGVNPDCLFAQYLHGGHFAPHIDGTTIANFNERSQYTLLIYLVDCMSGGETRFMTGDQCECLFTDQETGQITGKGANIVASVQPRKGTAVVFFHDVLHEGFPVGPKPADFPSDKLHRKVILRGDVMYRRVPPLHDEPNDRKAFELYQKARLLEADGRAMEAMKLFQSIRRLSPGIASVYQL